MAPPPPPPPIPKATGVKSGNDGRGMLLDSIRKGTTLKKAVTVDKSAPMICGKVSNGATNGNRGTISNNTRPNTTPKTSSPMMTGDLFAEGMPKLRPVNRNITTTNVEKNVTDEAPAKNGIVANAASASVKRSDRAPPQLPQLPPQRHVKTVNQHVSNTNNWQNEKRDKSERAENGVEEVLRANKSSLHSQNSINNAKNIEKTLTAPAINVKPHSPNLNYRKPYVAPKPPAMLNGNNNGQSIVSKPSPPPKNLQLNTTRAAQITRAQSMRVPSHSPLTPTSPTGAIIHNNVFMKDINSSITANNLKYTKHERSATLHRSHLPSENGINRTPVKLMASQLSTSISPSGRPTQPPPSRPPPNFRPPPPPPSQTGPAQTCASSSTTTHAPQFAPNSPPPLPPTHTRSHSPYTTNIQAPRTAPPPPPERRAVDSLPNKSHVDGGANKPQPPMRLSSMRNIAESKPAADLDVRFVRVFHTQHEFPVPDAFLKRDKQYWSRISTNKQQAPQPPSTAPPPRNTHIQLGNKLWSANSSSMC